MSDTPTAPASRIFLIIDSDAMRAQNLEQSLSPMLAKQEVGVIVLKNSCDAEKYLKAGNVYGMITNDTMMLTQEIREGHYNVPPHTQHMPIYQHGLGGEDYAVAFQSRKGCTFIKPMIPAEDLAGIAQAVGMNIKNPETFAKLYSGRTRS